MPVIGAVSSQIGTEANNSSVSSAGAEIISVGEQYVAKHAPQEPVSMPHPLILPEETEIRMTPIESQAVAMVTNVTNAPSTPPQTSQAIFNVSPQTFPPLSPLPVPIVPKDTMLTHPERRILRVKRPSLRQKNDMYEKDEVDELSERMEYLNIGSNVPKTIRSGTPWGLYGNGGNPRKRSVFV